MKKLFLTRGFIRKSSGYNQTFRIMRLTTCFLFLFTWFSFAENINSQNARVNLDKSQAQLKDVLDEIENQTDYLFISNRNINLEQRVSVHAKNKPVHEVLNNLFEKADLSFTMEGVNIILSQKVKEHAVPAPQQQDRRITGVIVDLSGEPIIGANVSIKGTTNGTITDVDGKFSLNAPANAILQVSYIGYNTQFIETGSKLNINVKLLEDTQKLDEVVVVGYATQKKVNLTGSVSAIKMEELVESRPITNMSNALQGVAAGVYVTSSGSAPGNDNGSIMVRGQGTLNDSAPLVIIDGVEGSMNNLNPQDVESISVLKDAASASIYGSRAANGVVLITTKSGKEGVVKVNYNGYVSFESINKIGASFNTVSDYATFMEIQNESMVNVGQTPRFSQNSIDTWREASKNPNGLTENGVPNWLAYPNTNWVDELYKTGVSTNHSLSISGGSEKVKFYTSFGYVNNPGIVENAGYERFNARANVEATIKPWISLGVNFSGYIGNYDPFSNNVKDLGAINSLPGQVLRSPDGRYGAPQNAEDNPQAGNVLHILHQSKADWKKQNMNSRFFGTLRPLKGLSITGSLTFDNLNEKRSSQPVFIDRWNFQTNTVTMGGTGRSQLTKYYNEENRLFMDAVARYETKFADKLSFSLLAGGSQENYTREYLTTSKYDLVDNSLSVPDAAIGESSTSGNGTEWTMRSFFGRLNLNWMDKYLLEANLRADASSRFLSNNRWGYFPSVSGAWRMDQEAFMEESKSWLSLLKVRASYGSLGNNGGTGVGNYDAISTYSTQNYILGNALNMGMSQTAIANANLTWETTYITDIGADFGFLNSRLTGTADYFKKRTDNILINLPAPSVHGNASIPKQNSAEVVNEGFEFALGWNDKIQEVSYHINGNFTWLRNEVTRFKGDERALDGSKMIQEGYPINIQFVRIADRLIQTDEDLAVVQKMLDNAPLDDKGKPQKVFSSGTPQKGDILYKDLNGDRIVDDKDRTTIGSGPTPKFTYGFNMGASWRGFDISVFLQGMAGVKTVFMDNTFRPVTGFGWAMNKDIADGRWYEGRTDAKYPRVMDTSDNRNGLASDFWMQNKSYFKIKNIQLGYNLPKSWMDKIDIEGVRIYGSLENFFTFTGYDGPDPETDGSRYPSMKQAVIGLNISF